MKDEAHVADTQPDTGALWTTVLEALARDGVPMPQRAFLQGAKIKGVLEQTVLVAVSNDFAKQVLVGKEDALGERGSFELHHLAGDR